MAKDRVIEGQSIQWHLHTTKYDICPTCKKRTIVRGKGRDRYCRGEECPTQFHTLVERR